MQTFGLHTKWYIKNMDMFKTAHLKMHVADFQPESDCMIVFFSWIV